jgi:hypothetical protein
MTDPRKAVEMFSAAAEARDRVAFADTLSVDGVRTLPQTRMGSPLLERSRRLGGGFTGDGAGRISAITGFRPEPYEAPRGPEPYGAPARREHLAERY